MIDEVDLHLHPRWQARILEDLVRIFPNVQLIVTTHSPVVVASVPRGNIRILGEDAATVPAMETRGRDAGDILNTVLGASSRPEEAGRLFDLFNYTALLGESKREVLEALLAEQGHLCAYCTCRIGVGDRLATIEHLFPHFCFVGLVLPECIP